VYKIHLWDLKLAIHYIFYIIFKNKNDDIYVILIFVFGELRASHMLGKYSTLVSFMSSSYWPNWGLMEMQKGQRIEDKHAESWDQVCWALGWRCTIVLLLSYFFYFVSFLYSLKPYFFSLFFKTLPLFYSLKSQSLGLHCPMFPLISSTTPKVLVLRLAETQLQLLIIHSPNSTTWATPLVDDLYFIWIKCKLMYISWEFMLYT
jgi:hypothetical protein